MKHSNKSFLAIIILALVLVGFYTVDFRGSDQASIISLPDFDTQVQPSQDQPINNLKDLNDAIVNIAEKTKPAVVTIFTTQTVEAPQNPLFRFFGDPRGGGSQEREVSGLGSGVVVSEDGYILTNNHVVEGAEDIRVGTLDGHELEAEIVGTDPMTDIAVLKINAENLPEIEFGNSDNLRVGEFVMAIGSPFGDNLAHSVSFGIVSGKGRTIGLAQRTGGYENFIQTDAAINPGNSGGALINLDGQLVGVNTAIASRSGGNQGVGFAIPANLAQNIMDQLIETGEVQRGYLGITGDGVDRTMARALGLEKPQGVIVGGVVDGGPASEAGLQEGDVITTLDGEAVDGWFSFRTEIASKRPGTEVEFGVIRDGEELDITVTLGQLPDDLRASAGPSQQGAPDRNLQERVGFSVQTLTPQIAEELQIDPNQNGVVVTNIRRNSDAYRQGLREGDVITSIAKEPVQNVSDFNDIMSQLVEEENQVVLMRILRGGNGLFIAFEL
ncbi:Do family serine endopeptidase [Halalkalibaculum sp. DA3122]|uniref:Do family serine endopeptidase n=1 Tax=unclassified Halalkalibaculum TaxID=2964617 RepID=UPI003754924F